MVESGHHLKKHPLTSTQQPFLPKGSLIARFMGPTWVHLGPTGPRWAPCWPHEPCYLGCCCHPCPSGYLISVRTRVRFLLHLQGIFKLAYQGVWFIFTGISKTYWSFNYLYAKYQQFSTIPWGCLRNHVSMVLNNTCDNIINKINTYSYEGFAAYVKKYIISSYSTECSTENCYVCGAWLLNMQSENYYMFMSSNVFPF